MATITIEKENFRAMIEAVQKEIRLNSQITLNINILNVHVEPKPRIPEIITDPARMLPDLLHSESWAQIEARLAKDPWMSYKDVAKGLGVSSATVKKYLRHDLIAGRYDGPCMGWFVRRSEMERLKDTPGWLEQFQGHVRNKPEPAPSDILHKKRLQVMDEIDDLRRYREPLNPAYVAKHNQGLLQRARRYFGSWRTALHVSGIDFSQAYIGACRGRPKMQDAEKKLRVDELLRDIKRWYAAGSLDRRKKKELSNSVLKYFGGWKNVFKLLGIKQARRRLSLNIPEEKNVQPELLCVS